MLTEHHIQPAKGLLRAPVQTDAIAICDYSMDSHGNAPAGRLHPQRTEGVFNRYVQPYQIPYRVTLPPQVDGLLVSCAVSSSHVGFSSLRMEPTWTAIGQAAGIAASMAVKSGKPLRDVDVEKLQSKLHDKGAKTIYVSDVEPEDEAFKILQYFGTKGFFHDLPEHRDQPYTGRGTTENMRGQHITKYPFHEANYRKLMDKELAGQWLRKFGVKSEAIPFERLTRLEFLTRLYRIKK